MIGVPKSSGTSRRRRSLAAQEQLEEDPQSGALFVFTNKRHNRLKVLWFDRNGFCVLYKRVSGAKFVLPDRRSIDATTLGWILRGVDRERRRRVRA